MTNTPIGVSATEPDSSAPEGESDKEPKKIEGRSPWQLVRARLRRDRLTMIALGMSVFFLLLGLAAPLLEKLDIINIDEHGELVQDLGSTPGGFGGGISGDHLLGVQPGSGRDLLGLIIKGMATSLLVSVLATIVAFVLGVAFGLIAGFAGGKVDWVISRFIDLVLSFPQTLMLLSLSTVLVTAIAGWTGTGDADFLPIAIYMIFVLGFFGFPYVARIIRGQVLSLRQREFVEAATSLGATKRRIYVKELLPHLWAPILVYFTLIMPQNIAAEATLGFLGVGFNPPTVSFGVLLNDSVTYAQTDPAYFLFPGVLLAIMVLSFNLLGDGLRDALDPKADRQ